MNKLISSFAQIFNFKLLKLITNQKFIFPFYHTVSNNDLIHIKHLYKYKTEIEFENDLKFLLKHYTTLNNFEKNIFEKNRKNKFVLSFDDGLKECYEVIAPILERYNINAIFLNTDFIDNKSLFYKFKISLIVEQIKTNCSDNIFLEIANKYFNKQKSKEEFIKYLKNIDLEKHYILDEIAKILNINFDDFLEKEKPYLTKYQIEDLIKRGFIIGAHSTNHLKYQEIDIKHQIKSTIESLQLIQKEFNIKEKYFAFPFTDFEIEKSFFDYIFNNNFANYTFGTAGLKKDSIEKNIQRIPMERENYTAKYILKYEYFYYIIKSFFGKNKIKRK